MIIPIQDRRTFFSLKQILLIVGIATILSFFCRYFFFPVQSFDYKAALLPWFLQLQQHDHLAALVYPIGNYSPPYMTILALLTYINVNALYTIKAVSILFDIVLAVSSACIVQQINSPGIKTWCKQAVLTYCTVLFLPIVILNSSCWAQCDSIYVSFLFLCVLFILKERYITAFVFFGIAFSFKLQAVFLLPVLFILLILNKNFPKKKKISLIHFLLIPVVLFISILPALAAGRHLADIAGVYLQQTQDYLLLSVGYPNLPYLFNEYDAPWMTAFFIILTFAILAAGAIFIYRSKIYPSRTALIGICIWCTYTCVLFLPRMHDRYGYFFEVLSIIYVVLQRRQWYLAVGVNTIGFLAYLPFLFNLKQMNITALSVANLFIFILFSIQCVKYAKQHSGHLVNQIE